VRTNQDLDAIIAIHGITSEVHPPHRLRGMCARNTRGSSRLLTYTLFTSSSNPQPEFIRRRREGFPFAQLGSRELEISRNVPDENLSTEWVLDLTDTATMCAGLLARALRAGIACGTATPPLNGHIARPIRAAKDDAPARTHGALISLLHVAARLRVTSALHDRSRHNHSYRLRDL
jgi:hypothetical protein